MKIYMVGGAVRDRLLGLPVNDHDWVVVGSTPEAMQAQGFVPVGKDFPVFLHPQTHEEYALARTERKTGRGYHGFAFHAAPDVTLDDDLARRDLTINAMAKAADGRLIDPFHGQRDLQAKVLRHVGPAFAEDPVRILRIARFAARFSDFSIAPETLELMRGMVAAGEVDHLVAERVWQELAKGLMEAKPSRMIVVLRECGALARLLPELDCLFGVPQRADYHPEIDTGVHAELVCDMAARLAPGDDLVGYAALCHDLGKALTPADKLPAHVMHEQRGIDPVIAMSRRLKVPAEHRDLAVLCCREHLNVHRIDELKDATVHDVIARCDGFRKPQRIGQLATVCEADKRGRTGLSEVAYPQADTLRRLHAAALAVRSDAIAAQGITGPAFGDALRKERIVAIAEAKNEAAT